MVVLKQPMLLLSYKKVIHFINTSIPLCVIVKKKVNQTVVLFLQHSFQSAKQQLASI